jgi:transposase
MRLGWFRPVHCKSIAAQEIRAILTARKLVQSKLLDLENSLRGILRGFGLKVGKTTRTNFAGRIEELVKGSEPSDHRQKPGVRLSELSMHTSIHSGGTGIIRHSPRNGFNSL